MGHCWESNAYEKCLPEEKEKDWQLIIVVMGKEKAFLSVFCNLTKRSNHLVVLKHSHVVIQITPTLHIFVGFINLIVILQKCMALEYLVTQRDRTPKALNNSTTNRDMTMQFQCGQLAYSAHGNPQGILFSLECPCFKISQSIWAGQITREKSLVKSLFLT